MPTPFYHLYLAEVLLQHPRLPDEVRQFLQSSRCSFLFGNTAPDVQVISGQPRQETHFFNLPIQVGDQPAWERMLAEYPGIRYASSLDEQQAAFLAGYLCHLQADWLWVKNIFAPVFGPRCSWGTFKERLYIHNVLRAYLDVHVLHTLRPGTDMCLGHVEPSGWLPFVEDYHLAQWRNLLSPQLQAGAITQTVEVFSSRGGVPAPEFHALLDSEERMQREVFERLPKEKIEQYQLLIMDESSRLMANYLAFTLHSI